LRWDARALSVLLATSAVAVAVGAGTSVHAIPVPEPPRSRPTGASPTPAPSGATLPFGSPLLFVLDDSVNSASTPTGTIVRMHLLSPLVVNGITLAEAGDRGSFSVVSTRKAQSGDVDGAIQIYVDPLPLPARHLTLPLRAVHEYLTRELTGGQRSTRAATDTVEDVFVPYAFLYQVLRKGHQMIMPVGTVLRAETAATIDASNPADVVLATPPPFVSNYDAPHSDLTPAPFFTPAPQFPRGRRGRPTVAPHSPSPAASGAAYPAASGAPVPGVSSAASPTGVGSASPAAAASAGSAAPAPSASAGPVSPVPTPSRPSVSASPTAVPY
jgi:hypothetical protein